MTSPYPAPPFATLPPPLLYTLIIHVVADSFICRNHFLSSSSSSSASASSSTQVQPPRNSSPFATAAIAGGGTRYNSNTSVRPSIRPFPLSLSPLRDRRISDRKPTNGDDTCSSNPPQKKKNTPLTKDRLSGRRRVTRDRRKGERERAIKKQY